MARRFKKYVISLFFLMISLNLSAQIGAIKGLAEGGADLFSSLAGSDAGCSAMACCWENGALFLLDFMVEHHQQIMKLRDVDPTVISFEARAGFALGMHYSSNKIYTYVNYLPGLRGNLGVFSTDFRYNILTEYTNDFPNLFTSWEWLFLINFEPQESFKLTFGTGVQMEKYTDSFYNEHYLGFKIGVFDNRDYINFDGRVSMDYSNGKFPFTEGGISYNTRIISMNNAYVYITFGGVYQNYYSAHDVWAFQSGLSLNIH